MAFDFETVTRIRPARKDNFGDPIPGTGAADLDIAGCLVAPGASSENHDGANQVVTSLTVYAPPAVDVLAEDQMRVRGKVYEVIGAPADYGSSGVAIALRLVTG